MDIEFTDIEGRHLIVAKSAIKLIEPLQLSFNHRCYIEIGKECKVFVISEEEYKQIRINSNGKRRTECNTKPDSGIDT